MLKKKWLLLACVSVVSMMLNVAAAADHPSDNTSDYMSGYILGFSYATYGQTDFAALFGYVNNWFIGDIGTGYERVNVTGGTHSSVLGLRGHVGMRHYLEQFVFLTYGALGAYGFKSGGGSAATDPYAVGAFVGVDYQPAPHLLLSAKIAPLAYVRLLTKTTGWNVFSSGSFGVSYIF